MVQPEYPGGLEKFYQFLGQTYKYPSAAKEKGVKGRILLNFLVDIDGSLKDIKIIKDLGYGTGEEAVRVLNASPKWLPGMVEGKPARIRYTLPIMVEAGTSVKELQINGTNSSQACFIVNGKNIPAEDAKKIDPKTVESINVIKDKEKFKEYGAPADATGIVIIKLK